jgi:ParB-like chromosome segregation protein Spo0J
VSASQVNHPGSDFEVPGGLVLMDTPGSRNTSELAVVYQEIKQLVPYPLNARTHSKRQIRQIAYSIGAFGFTNPVLVDRSGTIVAGHGRVEAAKLLGMKKVPTICLETLNEDQKGF